MESRSILTILNKQTGELETRNIHTGELVATSNAMVAGAAFIYSMEVADAICSLVREGLTYKKISMLRNMPSLHLIFAWKNAHPDFAKRLKEARADRAALFHDRAVEVLEDDEPLTRDAVTAAKFKFDGWLKLAEKGDPNTYSAKPTSLPSSQAPTMIVINTGISRDEPITVNGEVYEKESTNAGGRIHVTGGLPESEPITEVREAIGAEISGLGDEPEGIESGSREENGDYLEEEGIQEESKEESF